MNNLPGFFFVVGVCFFLLNNNFSHFNDAAYHIDTKYLLPGFVSGLFFFWGGGREGVSMGVFQFRST